MRKRWKLQRERPRNEIDIERQRECDWEMACSINEIDVVPHRAVSVVQKNEWLHLWSDVFRLVGLGKSKLCAPVLLSTLPFLCKSQSKRGMKVQGTAKLESDTWASSLALQQGLNTSLRAQPSLMECCYPVWVALWPVQDCTYFPWLWRERYPRLTLMPEIRTQPQHLRHYYTVIPVSLYLPNISSFRLLWR